MDELFRKRIAAIDYGKKRIGIASCDEFHITISPKGVILNNSNVLSNIRDFVENENIRALVVGLPLRDDERNADFINEIRNFINKLKITTGLPCFEQDESFSSKKATEIMINNKTKKSKRRKKGSTDQVAAAVILRDFLQQREGGFYA